MFNAQPNGSSLFGSIEASKPFNLFSPQASTQQQQPNAALQNPQGNQFNILNQQSHGSYAPNQMIGSQNQPFLQSIFGTPQQRGLLENSNSDAVNPAIPAQIVRMQAAWDRNSTLCEFQYYFFNRVSREEAALYTKPANQDQRKWEEAIAKRPDECSIPVLAVGFEDISRRINCQKQQVLVYRTRMHEIAAKLNELANKSDAYTNSKIEEAQIKHVDLKKRILNIAIKLQILRMRGYVPTREEEHMKLRLSKLVSRLKDPSSFGRMHELWARMVYVREQIKKIESEGCENSEVILPQELTKVEKFVKALKDQQTAIAYISKVLIEDQKKLQDFSQMTV